MPVTCSAIECGIALGSNTGDRRAHLRTAIAELRRIDPSLEVSGVYETDPVDCPEGSEAFLNAAAVMRWCDTPGALLAVLRSIESSLGRPDQRARNAPRPIDLDILYAGATISSDPALILPHPRLHRRRFVLKPLADLRPEMILPGFSVPVRTLLETLPAEGSERLVSLD